MKGKSSFSQEEIEEICRLIDLKQISSSEKQIGIRDKIRALGFYAEEWGLKGKKGGYTKDDFLQAINENNSIANKLKNWIQEYKKLIKGELPDVEYNEIYKWETIQHFQDNWHDDHDQYSILDNLKRSFNKENNNLWSGSHFLPYKMLVQFAQLDPFAVSEMMHILFDEKKDINDRLEFFEKKAEELKEIIHPKQGKSSYHDDRALALYLFLRYPDKYYLYQNSMYNDFCRLTNLGYKPGKGKKYDYNILIEYFRMCDNIRDILLKDSELIEIHNNRIPATIKFDDSHLLTQDFIYSVTTYLKDRIEKDENEKYKETTFMKIDYPLNQILYGPPGTGKTYHTVNTALELIGEDISGMTRNDIKSIFDAKVAEGQIVFTTFHQSMSYEDFVEGIKPQEPLKDDQPISYKIESGIFKRLCQSANSLTSSTFEKSYNKLLEDLKVLEDGIEVPMKDKSFKIFPHPNGIDLAVESDTYINSITKAGLKYVSDSQRFVGVWGKFYREMFKLLTQRYGYEQYQKDVNKNYVLIIDEINRGNVSQIFGELITLLEDDKRLGKPEALQITLPYSKEKFGVPPNLYILGTMNTADRSVEALDSALRRRFSFVEMNPDYQLKELKYELYGYKASDILRTINRRLETLLDRDHQIGHSYLLKNDGQEARSLVFQAFTRKIIPLLQEYFYNDYARIGLVLGSGFIRRADWDQQIAFANFDFEANNLMDEKPIFEIIPADEIDLEAAIHQLMNDHAS